MPGVFDEEDVVSVVEDAATARRVNAAQRAATNATAVDDVGAIRKGGQRTAARGQ